MENVLLESLLKNELLNEETKAQLTESFKTIIAEAKETARQEVMVELSKQFVEDKAELIEALDTKANARLTAELKEFDEDILRYRDQEVEYAARLVEAKEELQKQAKSDLKQLVEQVDEFLDVILKEQFTELKEDINECKKIRYGAAIFEAVQKTFETKFVNKDDTATKLAEANEKLEQITKKLNESTEQFKKVQKDQALTAVLENLNGRSRELMEVILKNVPTEKLEETYAKHITKVLNETVISTPAPSEKEGNNVLAENTDTTKTEPVIEGKKVTGDNVILEADRKAEQVTQVSAEILRARRLAGMV